MRCSVGRTWPARDVFAPVPEMNVVSLNPGGIPLLSRRPLRVGIRSGRYTTALGGMGKMNVDRIRNEREPDLLPTAVLASSSREDLVLRGVWPKPQASASRTQAKLPP